jgi:alpha-L-fucosidase
MPGVDWETCMTMNGKGFNRADKDFKPARTLVRNLVDIASKGGNFLLNVGPTAEGELPAESVERLTEIGDFMRVAGDSIHGTQASPFPSPSWGRCTQRRRQTTRLTFSGTAERRRLVVGPAQRRPRRPSAGRRGRSI